MTLPDDPLGLDGLKWAIEAGVDDIQHATAATDEDIKMILQKNLPITSTILDHRQDEPGDLKQWAPYSRWRLMEHRRHLGPWSPGTP